MSEANQKVLESVAAKLEAEGIPVPMAFKGKLNTEDSLILHVFLDHLYSQVLPNLKQARKELAKYAEEVGKDMSTEAVEVYKWIKSLEETLKEGYDIFAKEVEVVPDLATMKVFRQKLEEELQYAMKLSLESMAAEQGIELNGNGNADSN